tara:strand:+ start:255 stop:1880 length:1626 start_codon:yes stop_codon:yes gene_type:complete
MSIFQLPKSSTFDANSSNAGIYNQKLTQVASSREIASAAFPNGDIRYKWNVPSSQWWLPDNSYISAQYDLTRGDGAAITMEDGVSAAMNMLSTQFQTCELLMNGTTLSRTSAYVPQVSTLEHRLSKTGSWLDSIGSATMNYDSLEVRQVNLANDGNRNGEVPSTEQVDSQAVLGMGATTEIAVTPQVAGSPALLTFSVVTRTKAQLQELFPVNSVIRFGAALGGVTECLVVGHDTNVLLVASDITVVGAAVVAFSRVIRGVEAGRRVKTFELSWKPPLSVLTSIKHAIPGECNMELILQPLPSSSYMTSAVQTKLGSTKAQGLTANDIKLDLKSMFYYTQIVEGARVSGNENYILDLQQTRCQSSIVTSADSAQYLFEISPSTRAISFALQDIRCDSNTSFSTTEFKSYNNAGTERVDDLLTRFSISYGGRQYPSPDAQVSFNTGTDLTTREYLNTHLQSGLYSSDAGPETLSQFGDRGRIVYIEIPRDNRDKSTRLVVTLQFVSTAEFANTRILLFDHSTQIGQISMVDESVRDIVIADA